MTTVNGHVLDPVRIALPSKGHLYEGIVEILKTAGYKVRRASDRQYEAIISGHPRFHVVFMRPSDIVTQVDEGRCHLGVTGMDVFAERAEESPDARVVIEDLGYGGCRLVVAVPESWIDVTHVLDLVDLTADFKADGKSFRVSTKYPALTKAHFRRWGLHDFQVIDSDGALELHPSLGIADIIVDLTSSGTTLKDNRLREIEGGKVLESASCLIGHEPSLRTLVSEGDSGPLALLLDAIDGVRRHRGLAAPGGGGRSGDVRLRGGGRVPSREESPPHHARRGLGRTQRRPAGASPPWSKPVPSPPSNAPSCAEAPEGSSASPPASPSIATENPPSTGWRRGWRNGRLWRVRAIDPL